MALPRERFCLFGKNSNRAIQLAMSEFVTLLRHLKQALKITKDYNKTLGSELTEEDLLQKLHQLKEPAGSLDAAAAEPELLADAGAIHSQEQAAATTDIQDPAGRVCVSTGQILYQGEISKFASNTYVLEVRVGNNNRATCYIKNYLTNTNYKGETVVSSGRMYFQFSVYDSLSELIGLVEHCIRHKKAILESQQQTPPISRPRT